VLFFQKILAAKSFSCFVSELNYGGNLENVWLNFN